MDHIVSIYIFIGVILPAWFGMIMVLHYVYRR